MASRAWAWAMVASEARRATDGEHVGREPKRRAVLLVDVHARQAVTPPLATRNQRRKWEAALHNAPLRL